MKDYLITYYIQTSTHDSQYWCVYLLWVNRWSKWHTRKEMGLPEYTSNQLDQCLLTLLKRLFEQAVHLYWMIHTMNFCTFNDLCNPNNSPGQACQPDVICTNCIIQFFIKPWKCPHFGEKRPFNISCMWRGCSPVCVLMWIPRALFQEKAYVFTLQVKGGSPESVFMCLIKLHFW